MSEILTYSGIMFDPLHPNADLIDITDIAHALSMLCRANGHFKTFYSVGQHSINCAREAAARGYSQRIQLGCLLHDGSEAYLSDVTRPVKQELPQYKKIEAPLQEAIWNKYLDTPLDTQELIQVFQIDDAILAHEFLTLMSKPLVEPAPAISSQPNFEFSSFVACEQAFLGLFRKLTGAANGFHVVGIDWMKPCWLAVEILDGEISAHKLSHVSQISRFADADAVLIDIPIGLPESPQEAACRPDVAARALLSGARKSTVFPVPCRQAVWMDDYHNASAENARILGKKLPSQSFAFANTIRQVDDFLAQNPYWANRLTESHPEIAFQMLNGGKGLKYSKHKPEGIAERVAIIQSHGIDPSHLLSRFSPKQHKDVLDALCLAVSAKLGCENGFTTIPANPVCDSHGLKMQMEFGTEERK